MSEEMQSPETYRNALPPNDRADFDSAISRADQYTASLSWIDKTAAKAVAAYFPGIILILQVKVEPPPEPGLDAVWTVTGDVPPAYFPADGPRTPSEVLEDYDYEMRRWVEAVRQNQPTDGLIPVNAPETDQWAGRLASRLDFLIEKVAPELRKDPARSSPNS